MSLQAQLNQQAIDMLPIIKKVIMEAPTQIGNTMYQHTIREICNLCTPLDEMHDTQKQTFTNQLLEAFKYNRWI